MSGPGTSLGHIVASLLDGDGPNSTTSSLGYRQVAQQVV